MAAEKITAETRTEFGKGAARRIRRADKVPAVIYGHGNDPIHVTLPGHDTMMALKHGGSNALLELDIEGTSQLALTREVQIDPIKRHLEHIDFVAVRQGEKVTVDIDVLLVGDAGPDTLVVTENTRVSVEAEATHIPENIEVSIEGAPGRHPDPRLRPRSSPRAAGCSPTATSWWSTSPTRRPRRRSRPSWKRPRPRPASSARSTRRPPRRLPPATAPTATPPRATSLPRAAPRTDPAVALGRRSILMKFLRRGREFPMTESTTDVWLVVGLGNPGPSYAGHRHNIGYLVVEELASRMGSSFRAHKSGRAEVVEGRLGAPGEPGPRVVLARPRTYMNESGGAVSALVKFYKLPPERIVAVHDELDLPFGRMRVKLGGGDNGHNGLRSMRSSLGTGDFHRVRVGIGRPPGRQDVADFVLSNYSSAERKDVPIQVMDAADAVECLVTEGLDKTQQKFNS